ncbi:NAD kinase 2, mitochondrial isoform X2 [Dermacentor variabilis]|uniref:NAD kinase 2, mitochondrial isoform X2 n=1 Tax=Dermacentor variabilis TaxID=34621 RepID=UPI003F5B1B14
MRYCACRFLHRAVAVNRPSASAASLSSDTLLGGGVVTRRWCDRLLRSQAETCKRGGERAMKQIWRVALRRNYSSSHASLPSLSPAVRHRGGTARTGNLLLLLAPIRSAAYYPACRRGGAVVPSRLVVAPAAAMHFSTSSTAAAQFGSAEEPVFRPRRALVLTKFSRYEFEKRRHAHLTEEQLVQDESRGSDYNSLVHHHKIHTKNRELVVNTLRENGIETRLVDRFEYTDSNIDWADVIFTTGGDGTFLMAASKIHTRDKPIIGINSDPSRSVGYLCLPGHYTENFPLALKRLLTGKFQWMWRQRLRVTLKGEHAFDPPVELHDQQLQYPEYRFLDCWQEQHRKPTTDDGGLQHSSAGDVVHVLPVRSLNEVFVGESLSSRVSYYELSVDGSPRTKLKSSGLTICSGTGSTSWSFNINKVTPQCIQRILDIVTAETGVDLPTRDPKLIERVTTNFNNSLIFDPSKCRMAYTIRDPVVFGTDFNSKPRGFAKRIEVKSRMFDACLVIDGGLSFVFNDGATAVFEIFDEDALRTVQFAD